MCICEIEEVVIFCCISQLRFHLLEIKVRLYNTCFKLSEAMMIPSFESKLEMRGLTESQFGINICELNVMK